MSGGGKKRLDTPDDVEKKLFRGVCVGGGGYKCQLSVKTLGYLSVVC